MKRDYDETLFDGLRVYHNPHATRPLDWRVFEEPGAYQAMCVNPETHEWKYWMDRPPLVARNLITMNLPDMDLTTLQAEAAKWPKSSWGRIEVSPAVIKAMQMGTGEEGAVAG